MLVLGESGRDFDETRWQDALSKLCQPLQALDASRLACGRVHGAVFEASFDSEEVDPRLGQWKPDLDVLARRLGGTSTTAVVPGHHHLNNVTH